MTRAQSGRRSEDITVEAARAGVLTLDDIRISAETLHEQARIAEAHRLPQLADNFRRAAEMTVLTNDEVFTLYEALRPHRSTKADLESIAESLADRGALACAELVREAAAAYARRELLR